MERRQQAIERLYEKYSPIMKGWIYNSLFSYDHQRGWKDNSSFYEKDDVINIAFEKFLHRKRDEQDIEKLERSFQNTVKYLILEAIRDLSKKINSDLMIIGDESIKDFYDKVKFLMDEKGYNEEEAKEIVRIKESLLRNRLVKRANLSNPSEEVEDTREYYDKVPIDEDHNNAEKEVIDFQQANLLVKARAICFLKYKKNHSKRDYKILCRYHFKNVSQTELARTYVLSTARVNIIKKKGMKFIRDCIKCVLNQKLCEVA